MAIIGEIYFSTAINADVCPVAEFGPINIKKLGKPFITEVLYAPGPPY